nr:farnesyl diphosphate synthase [Blautia wexlerae]
MGHSVNFQEELTKKTKEIEAVIREYLPAEEGFSRTMAQAMNYSMLAGGKRLRPMLMQETFRLFGGSGKLVKPFMAGMEMIHTHSLIHDDLPALDNDDYRRGRLTTHKVYGEAMGILSGVALLNYAYETMLQAFAMAETLLQKEAVIDALQVMAEKTGIHGMLGGQSVDVENDGKALEKDMLDYIYENKTAALIEASMMTGAILAGADAEQVSVIEQAAKRIGLAFQIQDDILDVTSTDEELGKPVHSDEKNHKVTYVTLFGTEKAAAQVAGLSAEAVELLESLNKNNEFLYLLVEKLVNRRK